MMVVKSYYVQSTALEEMVVWVRLVASRCYRASRVVSAHDIAQVARKY